MMMDMCRANQNVELTLELIMTPSGCGGRIKGKHWLAIYYGDESELDGRFQAMWGMFVGLASWWIRRGGLTLTI